jgi:3-oxoacyl-[acyl-carrier protein] reductase
MYALKEKAILVTGSTRGIGRALAESLVGLGAIVGVHGRNIDRARAACGEISPGLKNVIAVGGDFSDPENGGRVVGEFVAASGGIDGLVNNAGFGKASAFRGMTLEKWRATMAVDLEAAMCASREAYSLMRQQEHGSIVNVASVAAHGPGIVMGADYAAGKAGLVSLTRTLAFEAARFGVRVNAVSPGMVDTDMTAPLTGEQKKSARIPMGRFARAQEIADVILFLLSDASSYITGQVLHVNGGLRM